MIAGERNQVHSVGFGELRNRISRQQTATITR